MEIRLGIAPIAWTNNDLPQLGGDDQSGDLPDGEPAGRLLRHGDRRQIPDGSDDPGADPRPP